MHKPKILVIVGPTASGKTSLSIELAKICNGEVISADSRQVYRGLNLGTGKVTKQEMHGIPHHLLDIASPEEIYTVTDFIRDGREAIADITNRNKLPIIVGGTFFYIDALLGKVSMPEVPPNPALRTELEKCSNAELLEMIQKKDARRAEIIDPDNKRRLIRALEIIGALGSVPEIVPESLYDVLTIGIEIEREKLNENIHKRLIERIKTGMIDEVKTLNEAGLSFERMEDLGLEYRYIARFLQNQLTHDEMLIELETKIRQYAKRQMTWLKRDTTIQWFKADEMSDIENKVNEFIR